MSALVVRDAHSSWYMPTPGGENRNIAREAYQNAVKKLEDELHVSLDASSSSAPSASAKDVLAVVETARLKYEEKSKEHTGMQKSLERLSSRILYYSKVLDTLAQHHPEYVALAWGALKLVLTGIINRANLVQKLLQALIAIGDVLPRLDLSAELYQTEYMEAALSRLYAYIMLFFRLCVRWYNRSPLGRLWSAITTPFELDYQELVEQIQHCSQAVDDLANAGARAEIRHVRTLADLQHTQLREHGVKLSQILERQKKADELLAQVMQIATSHKTITERMGEDVRGISQGVYRIEFHHVIQFFAPTILPETVLSKVQSLVRRNPTPSLPSTADLKMRNTIREWALSNVSSFLIVQVGLRAQRQAKELAMDVIENFKSGTRCVFWSVALPSTSPSACSMNEVFKSIIFQILQYSGDMFSSFAEQLNLYKISGTHTESEWVDLLCLLFSKLPKTSLIIETETLHKTYRHEPDWAKCFCGYLQSIVDRSTAAGNELKLLLIVYGNTFQIAPNESGAVNIVVASLRPPSPVPPRFQRRVRRSGLMSQGWKLQRPKLQI
ncbi:hypothetical protein DDE82_004509 [Stemphylium lycopersici]|nr:hypothetical protein DDE82_004509 [Stemphylium lycopersici]